jgi:hypothetical protein
MKMIDPTYLRTIYDGLNSGTMHKDNAATLPIGLIGIYEEALPPSSNVNERNKFLEFFGVWALLKKEVSAGFVASLLEGWTETQVLEYIGKYSKWFNSPVSGMYVLYHERLRSFAIQKISQRHFDKCNESIIQNCQAALQDKSGDEWERYALEHLSTHLLIQAMKSVNATALKVLAYNTAHWNRQVEISKGFEWSKHMLNDMMLWATKYDNDEVIECALNKVDLHHQEQNDAPRIVELVAQNDIETALQRIESFGGNDKEGLQRKFILYMICLMELTLLDSMDKPFRKDAIEKLLKHLDDNLPVDHSVLNWNDFFPNYLMFQMACEWAEMGINYLIVYKRIYDWESNWIFENGPFTEAEFEIMIEAARGIRTVEIKCRNFIFISNVLVEQSFFNRATLLLNEVQECIPTINSEEEKINLLQDISTILFKQGKKDESISVLNLANKYTQYLSSIDKSMSMANIASEMSKQGHFEKSFSLIIEALEIVNKINYNEELQSRALVRISIELAKQGKIEAALDCAASIPNKTNRSTSFKFIVGIMAEIGQFENAQKYTEIIEDSHCRSSAFKKIAIELAKKGRFTEAIECIKKLLFDEHLCEVLMVIYFETLTYSNINYEYLIEDSIKLALKIKNKKDKIKLLLHLATVLSNHKMIDKSMELLNEAINCANKLDNQEKSNTIMRIAISMVSNGNIDDAFKFISVVNMDIKNLYMQSKIKNMGIELMNKDRIIEFNLFLFKLIEMPKGIKEDNLKSIALKNIVNNIAKSGRFPIAISYSKEIINDNWRNTSYINIAEEFTKQMRSEEAISFANSIIDNYTKTGCFIAISEILYQQGFFPEAFTTLKDALTWVIEIESNISKDIRLISICRQFTKIKEIKKALDCVKYIDDESNKNKAYCEIIILLAESGRLEYVNSIVKKINSEYYKNIALKEVSVSLSNKSKHDKAIKIAHKISETYEKCSALNKIAFSLNNFGHSKEANKLIKNNLKLAKEIWIEQDKINIYIELYTFFSNKRKLKQAELHLKFAILIARSIKNELDKIRAIDFITNEIAKHSNWQLVENIGLEISQISEQHNCWKQIAQLTLKEAGWQKTLQISNQIQHVVVKREYLKGFADSISSIESNKELILNAQNFYHDDIESMENLLQKYAIHELFLGDATNEKIERLNKTLNFQWAINIKNSNIAN